MKTEAYRKAPIDPISTQIRAAKAPEVSELKLNLT
jgi:hypothetical protein